VGYYANALVLGAAPDAGRLPGLFKAGANVVVYKHRRAALWLVDAWIPTKRPHFPFTDEAPLQVLEAGEDDAADRYVAAAGALDDGLEGYAEPWIRWTQQAARTLGQDAFAFVADDEGRDAACLASPAGGLRCKARHEATAIEIDGAAVTVVPFDLVEDPEYNLPEEALDDLRELDGVQVAPARVIDGGHTLYGNVVALWPIGDPGELVGIGTWDPFLELERDFEVVSGVAGDNNSAAGGAAGATTTPRPWWKFW
jgi:hypothetical protein